MDLAMDTCLLLLVAVGVEAASNTLLSICAAMEDMQKQSRSVMVLGGEEVTAELRRLEACLFGIRDVLLLADVQSAPEGRALALLARDAAYSLDDLVDEVVYKQLQVELTTPTTKLKWGLYPLFSACLRFKSHILGCHGVSSSWKPCSRRVAEESLLKDLRRHGQDAEILLESLNKGTTGHSSFHPAPPLPTSPPDLGSRTVFVGRDKERHDILGMLTGGPCGQEEQQLKVISIVGLGGAGKTTLAHVVYNDATVDQHFDVKSWVFVSTGFSTVDLAAHILRSAQPACSDSAHKTPDLGMLQSELMQLVASKRFLIVLDDMSDEAAAAAWQDILFPLQSASTGSRILVTTRTNTVPFKLGASHVYSLNPLATEDLWSLFKKHALPSCSGDEQQELETIGRAIAAKLQGLPLAAKVVGKLLEAQRSIERWKNMDKLIRQDAVLRALLRLSYNHLPGHLKRCFAYCSLFPKNWNFDPVDLIRLWIAEGFIQPLCKAEEIIEDRARKYFDQLLLCSFFEELKIGSKTYYLVHDLLHDLAELETVDDCFCIDNKIVHDIPPTVRRMSVTGSNLHVLINFCNLKKLRTLIVRRSLSLGSNYFEAVLLEKSSNLRILDLSGCNMAELPDSIGNLPHLRYLSVHGTIRRLPASIGKLLHLQYLCFSQDCAIDMFPAAINMLVNLRYFGIQAKYTAELVGIRRLINLQGSLEVHVETFEGRRIEELKNINGLHGLLKIEGLENVSSKGEACRAELNKKIYLNSLSLEWGSACRKLHPPADADVLEGLLPHPDLRELCIRRYCGTKAPSWLQSPLLQKLQSLHLLNCRGLVTLPPLGHLRSLRTLLMKELPSVVRIDQEFYGTENVAFPSLSILEFDDFPTLHEWSGIADKKSFPCLKELRLIDCPKLSLIPSVPPTTSKITIQRSLMIQSMRLTPSSSSSEMLELDVSTSSILFMGLLHKEHLTSIVALNIYGAEHLAVTDELASAAEELSSLVSLQRLHLHRCGFTDETFGMFLQALPCLSSLDIIDLPKITSLPVLEKHKFCTMLKDLCIRNCHLLCCLSSLQFFDSLRYLVIERCPKLTETSFPLSLGNLSSLKVLRISYCSELQSLPVSGLLPSLETFHLVGCHPNLSRAIKKQ